MGKFNVNAAPSGNRIVNFPAGEAFIFEGSRKGNNGLCVRVKDSKRGKGRFLNLENGKLLTAGPRDEGTPVDVDINYEVD